MAHQHKEKEMNARKNIASLIGSAAVMAAAVGLTAGLTPASAAPAPSPGVNLWVFEDPANRANYRVTFRGVFPMDEYSAHGYINHLNDGERPGYVVYELIGDDGHETWITPAHRIDGNGPRDGGYLRAESDGIHFMQEISIPKDHLNEDRDGVDEVYGEVAFVDADGGARFAVTNVATGSF
jgi:hypothetical protein